jgi:VanZ family protein
LQHLFGVSDRVLHTLAFVTTSMTALLLWAPAASVALFLFMAAGSIEMAQLFASGRHPSTSDFAASVVGVILGIILGRVIWPRVFRYWSR